MKELEDTLIREIERLNEKSKEGPLDMNDVNILVKLTSSWSNYSKNPIDDNQDDYDEEVSTEDLLLLARQDIQDENKT
jgi:hypothetical protein